MVVRKIHYSEKDIDVILGIQRNIIEEDRSNAHCWLEQLIHQWFHQRPIDLNQKQCLTIYRLR